MPSTEELAKKRDDLNLSVKKNIDSVRAKIAELKGLNESAKKLRAERDAKNKIVADFRKKRDALNSDARKMILELKKFGAEIKKLPSADEPASLLKKKRDELDWKIQTEHHSIKKDEELRDDLEDLETKLASEGKRSEVFSKRSGLQGKVDKIREEAETLHSLIVDNSQAAKKAHEELITIYAKIKAIREEIAPVSKQIQEDKKQANDAHAELVLAKKSLREAHGNARVAKAKADEEKLREKAKELMRDFTQGKKLSTEEILIIQKYGE